MLILGCLALVAASGCGSSGSPDAGSGSSGAPDAGSGATVTRQVNLKVTTAGDGIVRGANGDCRGTCTTEYAAGTQIHLMAVAFSTASFVGWAGACNGTGACDLTLDSNREVSATFAFVPPPLPSDAIVLAPNDGTNETEIALNSTRLFWFRYSASTASSSIWSIPKEGGEAVRVASGFASLMVADDSDLYWTDGSVLHSTPVGGGDVAVLFTGSLIGELALDDSGALYWPVSDADTVGTVHRMQNGAETTIASGQTPVSLALAVDATHVYFGDYTGRKGSIRRVLRKGGTVESVFSCGSRYAKAIRLDSDNVYFRLSDDGFPSTNSGHVQALSKSDFKVRTLSGGNGDDGFQILMEVEVNASVVYWNWIGGTAPYGIFRANADGSGFRTVDSSNDSSWYGLRVDDTAVYYWHRGAIIRRLK